MSKYEVEQQFLRPSYNIKCTMRGTNREVADRARTTISLPPGTKEIPDSYIIKLAKAEHSPIRFREYSITITGVKSWLATHFARHHVGWQPYVSTQRDDRTGIGRNTLPQGALVDMHIDCNLQGLINVSRKRLCGCAHIEAQNLMADIIKALKVIDPLVEEVCVRECVYRGFCPEFKPACKYSKSEHFKEAVDKYRKAGHPEKEK